MEASAQASPALDAGFVEEWRSRYSAAWNAHDGEAVASLCTEDVVWQDPALPAPTRGRAAVREFVEAGQYRLALDALRATAEARNADPIGWLMRLRKAAASAEKSPPLQPADRHRAASARGPPTRRPG